jgi:enoyl-CoA hydratase
MHSAVMEAFLSVKGHQDIRAVVFAARGKAFSAGGDFDEIQAARADEKLRREMQAQGKPLLLSIADCPVPVITALQGDAVGLGATLILASDAIVAARTAKISDPHIVIGLAAGDGGCVTWPQHVGMLRAKRYLLTGERINAADAHAMGLVTDLVDTPEETLPAARALAARIAALPPMAVQNTKRALNKMFRERIELVFDFGFELEMQTFVSADAGEAIAAYREKRKPSYQGR